MRISLDDNLYSIWYENEAGDRFVPDLTGAMPPDPPAGYVYQHAQLTGRVDHDVLKIVQRAEVDTCPHPEVRPDNGLIEGLKGRRCTHCGGYQCVPTDREWPPIWDASGSILLASMSSGFTGNLVLAMVRPTEAERELALERSVQKSVIGFVRSDYAAVTGAKVGDTAVIRGPAPKLYSIYDAMLIAARSCEGCMNVLLWRYGCNDGYPEGSDEHKRAGTSCLFCRPVPTRYGRAHGISIGGHIAKRAET
jgi:hypothetical protein